MTARKSIPAGVKQPEDHKEPALRDVTVSWEGNEYTASSAAFGDYRTFRLLTRMEKNPAVLPDILDRLLGEDQHDALIEASEDETGHVPTEKIGEFLRALFEAAGQGNS
jgi:hypothetical protein